MTAIAPCVLPAGTQLGPQVPRPIRLASSLPLRHARLQALARLFFQQQSLLRSGRTDSASCTGSRTPGPPAPTSRCSGWQRCKARWWRHSNTPTLAAHVNPTRPFTPGCQGTRSSNGADCPSLRSHSSSDVCGLGEEERMEGHFSASCFTLVPPLQALRLLELAVLGSKAAPRLRAKCCSPRPPPRLAARFPQPCSSVPGAIDTEQGVRSI